MRENSTAKPSVWNPGSCSDFSPKEQYQVVDICKFAFAIFVVMIHVSPFSSYDSALVGGAGFVLRQAVCRIADPFYFVAAGFLLFRKIDPKNPDSETVRRYVFKILRLYGLWSLLLLVGGTGQLWFLGGLAIAVTFLYALLKWRVPFWAIGAISLAFYLVGAADISFGGGSLVAVLPSAVGKLYGGLNSTVKLAFIMGVPYVFLGMMFAQKRVVLNKAQAIAGCAVSFALIICEAIGLHTFGNPTDYYQLVTLYPFCFFAFYLATHIRLKDKPIYKELRIVGMIVFYSHLLCHRVVVLVCGILGKIGGVIGRLASDSLVQFLGTVFFAVALGVLIARGSQKERFSFLKYLYS